MLVFFEILLLLIILIILGWILFLYSFTRQLFLTFLKGEAPFVPTKASILPNIAEAMDLTERSVLYDLGCGDGRILVACQNREPRAEYVGFERNLIPYCWTKIRLKAMRLSKKIKIHRSDFFQADLSEATHIFLYLFPRQIEKLGPKLEKEINNGKKILSLRFDIPNITSREKILLGKENLYIYEKSAKS